MARSSAVNCARNLFSIVVEIDPEAFAFAVVVFALRLHSSVGVILNPDAFFGAVVVHAFFSDLSIRVIANKGAMTCSAVSGAVGFVVCDDRVGVNRAIKFWHFRFALDFDVHNACVVVVLVARIINVTIAAMVSRMNVLHTMARVSHDRSMRDGRATIRLVPLIIV